MKSLKNILTGYSTTGTDKYVSREFQDFGLRLAQDLGDLSHKSLYIKLAKSTPRLLLEEAKSFVLDSHAKNRGALFMWKLKELRLLKKKEQLEISD